MNDQLFVSCDWGTSLLRLKLVHTNDLEVVAGISSNDGIADTFKRWSSVPGVDRLQFYLAILQKQIKLLEHDAGFSLRGLPVIVSGMASSTIGMIVLDYSPIPANINCSNLNVRFFDPTNSFDHPLLLISGLRTDTDVMRGEETQIAGCLSIKPVSNGLFILPGTHSKHVVVENGQIVHFKTYMTGELFELLSRSSVLASSIEPAGDETEFRAEAFKSGLSKGAAGNFLNTIFTVRTNAIFQELSNLQNYFYLSGLLVGYELSTIINTGASNLVLVGKPSLTILYERALEHFKYRGNVTAIDGGEALVAGHKSILSLHI